MNIPNRLTMVISSLTSSLFLLHLMVEVVPFSNAFQFTTSSLSPTSTTTTTTTRIHDTLTSQLRLHPLSPSSSFYSLASALHLSKNNNNNNNNDTNDFDDLSSNINGNHDDDEAAGRDLAKEFYRQVRLRERQEAAATSREEKEGETWEVQPTKNTRPVNNNNNDNNNTTDGRSGMKFTGREKGEIDSSGTPSAGLFARQNGSVYAFPVERKSSSPSKNTGRNAFSPATAVNGDRRLSPREEMMRSEFDLVSVASNERSIILQGALVLVLLGFTLFVGMTGGITDGSERFGGVANEFNGLGESLDFMPQVTDTATSSGVEGSGGGVGSFSFGGVVGEMVERSSNGGSVWL